MKSKEWWGDPKNADKWIRRAELYDKFGEQSLSYVTEMIDKRMNDFESILEVGAGNGRLIGRLQTMYPENECASVDINPALSEYVRKGYGIKTYTGEIINLPIPDKSFDLVFTFTVLQHVPPEEIVKALEELKRVAKKEVWLFEGWGVFKDNPHGTLRHPADGGTWYWDISKLANCYHVEYIERSRNKKHNGGMRIYKIKL